MNNINLMKDIIFFVERLDYLNHRIFELTLRAAEPLPPVHCGQFVHLRPVASAGLRRPFCIYKHSNTTISVAIAIAGKGTKALSQLQRGDKVYAILPLGNGFRIDEARKNVALVGGGIGCAPLLDVPQCYPTHNYRAYLGFATMDDNVFSQEFHRYMNTLVSTDDGSEGFRGYVSQMLENDLQRFRPDIILCCGPTPMLRSIAVVAAQHSIPAFASMEQRMGCGVGACLVCVCAIRNADDSAHNMRVCADGPVFDLSTIMFTK
jgi:dihydroorotate dehydrogenase electron transfer subunit